MIEFKIQNSQFQLFEIRNFEFKGLKNRGRPTKFERKKYEYHNHLILDFSISYLFLRHFRFHSIIFGFFILRDAKLIPIFRNLKFRPHGISKYQNFEFQNMIGYTRLPWLAKNNDDIGRV